MFVIRSVSLSSPHSPQPFIIIGGQVGSQVISPSNPLGPEGSLYHLCFPNLGYITFSDVGPNIEPGVHGDWAVQFRSANGRVNYVGEGNINIVHDGLNFNAIGPFNTVTGTINHWQ